MVNSNGRKSSFHHSNQYGYYEGDKTAEPVEEIIEAVYKHLKKVYPEGEVTIQLPQEVVFIQADPILIEQALFNLVENAFRHGEKITPLS